ncbi:MAG TPA: cyclic nucleotide-binding domain-containing protein [Gammaproteobacteria bacterium]
MADEIDSGKSSPSPKKLGDFLIVARGNINNAVEKQIAAFAHGETVKPIGELLVEQGIISREELENSLRNQRIARLAGCPVFAPLSRPDLAALSKHFTEVSVAPGERFIMQWDEDRYLYVIAYGLVEVYKIDNFGNEITIAMVGAGEPIGEMGYFSGGKRSACVRAIEPTQLVRARYEDLTHYFESVPRVALAFTQVVEYRRKELARITGTATI